MSGAILMMPSTTTAESCWPYINHVLLGTVATREITIDDQYFKKFKYNMEYGLNQLDNYDLLIHCRLREEFNQDMTRKYVLESAMYGQLIPKLGKE